MTDISVIVGLGNPGAQYAYSRHNAGFQFLEKLVDRVHATLRSEARFRAHVGRARIAERQLWLVAPQDYMNNSGDCVAAFAAYYKIEAHHMLVVHDDLDLAPGDVRLKRGGGHGGHKGLRDIVCKLQSREFVRLRIGIGHPGASDQVTAYVLSRPTVAQRSLIQEAIDKALSQVDDIVLGHYESVMNTLHAPEEPEAPIAGQDS